MAAEKKRAVSGIVSRLALWPETKGGQEDAAVNELKKIAAWSNG